MDRAFELEFRRKQKEAFDINVAHGFHENDSNLLKVPACLALVASEVSEALEAHRKHKDEELPHELADIVIRCMDLAEMLGINLGKAIVEKTAVNKDRPYKHGNKLY